MSERKDGGIPSQKEVLGTLLDVILAPLTYAEELRERISRSGGFLAGIASTIVSILPVAVPIMVGLGIGLDKGVLFGMGAGLSVWVISGFIVNALHNRP